MKNIFKAIFRHKIISAILILLLAVGGYFGYKKLKNKEAGIQYVLAAVTKDTLIVSVSGTGQVSALDQEDIKSEVSADITYLGVENGQKVSSGILLAKLNTSDIEKTIEDAEENLQVEKFNLEKMKGISTDEGTLRGEKEKAEDDLQKAYEDGFNNIANIFLTLPNIMSGLNSILFSYSLSPVQQNIDYYANMVKGYDAKAITYQIDANEKYKVARTAYDKNLQDYKSASRLSDMDVIESLIAQNYETVKDIAEAVKSVNNFIQFYQDELTEHSLSPDTLSNTHLSSLSTYTNNTNSFLLTVLSSKNTIQSDKEAIIQAGFDIDDQEKKVEKAEKTLEEAKEKIADYSIYSPLSGTVTDIQVKKGDSISSGTTLATIITPQIIAEITLNEVDVAKIKVGQKTTLTFDALPEVSISGKVLEIDSIGTASQGVVSYGIKISFDTQDERVKPGMSVTADIITDVKQNVLTLPNSAIKSQGNSKYVEFVEASSDLKQKLLASASGVSLTSSPKQQSIETGISNDTSTEIVSGLSEGDIVVTSTVSSSTSSNSSTTRSNQNQIRIPGVGGFGEGR
jgi:HlyD family secretion protein